MPFDPNTADNTPAGFIPSLFGQPSPVQQQGGGTALGMAEDPFPQPGGGGGGIVSGRGHAPTSRPSAPAPTPSAPAPSAPAPSASATAPPKPPNPSGSFNDMIGADSGVGSGGATTSSGSFNDFIGARAGHGANFTGGNMGHGPVMGLADGGAIPDGDEDDIDPMSSLPESENVDDRRTDNAFGVDTPTSKKTIGMWASGADTSGIGQDENSGGGALSVVDRVLQYGRQMHGLLGGQDQNDGVVPKQQMGFDDGGAVPDGDDENNIGLQDEQDPNAQQPQMDDTTRLRRQMGASIGMHAPDQEQQDPAQGDSDDALGNMQDGQDKSFYNGQSPGQALRSGGQQVLRYLMGATAAPPDQVKALEQQVDPQNQMDPNEKVPQVIASAAEQGGDDAGFNTMQHYRKVYDASKGFAAAALDQGNMASATHAATQAFTNVPDGQGVRFTEDTPGYVTAAVTQGGKNVMLTQITTQQFGQLLRKDGQFDNVMAKGVPSILSQMSKQMGAPQAPQSPQAGAPQAPQSPQAGAPQAPFSLPGEPPHGDNGDGTYTVRVQYGFPGQRGYRVEFQRVPTAGGPLDPYAKSKPGVMDKNGPQTRPGDDQRNWPQGSTPAPGRRSGAGGSQPFRYATDVDGTRFRTDLFPQGPSGQWRPAPGQAPIATAGMTTPGTPLERSARQMFPSEGDNAKRAQYVAQQQQQQQKLDTDRIKANNPIGVAQVRGASGVQREQVKQEGTKYVADTRAIAYTDKNTKQIELGLAKIAQSNADARTKAVVPVLRQYLAGRPLGQPADPGMDEAIHTLMSQLGVQLEQGPAPQQPQGAAPAAPQGAFKPPAGWVFSPSRKQYRDQQGIIYDQNGNRVQ